MDVLAPELLRAIISHIERPIDLLNFGLTCRRIQTWSIPEPLSWYVLRCDLRRMFVWKNLRTRVHILSQIRELSVYDMQAIAPYEAQEIIPIDLREGWEGLNHIRRFPLGPTTPIIALCLKRMFRLKIFTWPWPSSSESIDILFLFKILSQFCHELVHLEFHYRTGAEFHHYEGLDVPITFKSVTKLSLTLEDRSAIVKGENVDKALDVLISSFPALVSLRLTIATSYIRFPRFLLEGHWNNLEILHLDSVASFDVFYTAAVTDTDKSDILREFLQRHSRLRSVTIVPADILRSGCFPSNSLPSLVSLWIGIDMRLPMLRELLPMDIARNLEYLQVQIFSEECTQYLAFFTRLKFLLVPTIPEELIPSFIDSLPTSIERLSFPSLQDEMAVHIYHANIARLRRLTNLTHLGDLFSRCKFMDSGTNEGNHLLCRSLCDIQKLEYVEIGSGDKPHWIILIRQEDGNYLDYEDQEEKTTSHITEWHGCPIQRNVWEFWEIFI